MLFITNQSIFIVFVMSIYLNNPSIVIALKLPSFELKSSIKSILSELCPKTENVAQSQDQSIQHVLSFYENLEDEDKENCLRVSVLNGGITNALYLVEIEEKSNCTNDPDDKAINMMKPRCQLIFRCFGQGTEQIIDRSTENIIFASLSSLSTSLRMKIPTFYGLFENGRVEGYLPGTKTLIPSELYDQRYIPQIADVLACFHQIEIDRISHEVFLWPKIESFFTIASEPFSFDDELKQDIYNNLDIATMRDEFSKLKRSIIADSEIKHSSHNHQIHMVSTSSRDSSSIFKSLGRKFGYKVVLCHNDLLCGNILYSEGESAGDESINDPTILSQESFGSSLNVGSDAHYQDHSSMPISKEKSRVSLIDYEYCGYNYLAYDIANHFCEFCGFDYALSNLQQYFPNTNVRRIFLTAYVESYGSEILERLALKPIDEDCSLSQSIKLGLNIQNSEGKEFQDFISGLDETVIKFTSASHFFWGTWSIVQAKVSQLDFDYIGYAKLRYEAYAHHKQLFKYPW